MWPSSESGCNTGIALFPRNVKVRSHLPKQLMPVVQLPVATLLGK